MRNARAKGSTDARVTIPPVVSPQGDTTACEGGATRWGASVFTMAGEARSFQWMEDQPPTEVTMRTLRKIRPAARKITNRATRKSEATAGAVMTSEPETIEEDASLFEAASLMAEIGVRHLPVVDTNGILTGMLSDRDVRSAIGDPGNALRNFSEEWEGKRVADVMTQDPVRAELVTTVADIATMLADEKIGAVPVVNETDRPVGIVSYVDLIRFLAEKN